MKSINLTDQFLIAMPSLVDPNFFQTVTYIFSHNNEGAMGIVINRPLNMELSEILTQMDIDTVDHGVGNLPVYDGGPVKTDRGFIIHEPDAKWQSSIQVGDDIEVTTSRDILEAISEGRGPQQAFIALGYAGWGAGQLEQEIMENCWLNTPSRSDIIFNSPADRRWQIAASLLGVDVQTISTQIGHA
jgi:putative transcriptional regulator